MTTPLTHEPAWRAFLERLPVWKPSAPRSLILSPHPDDETLGCGGLIASQIALGAEVLVVAVTDGEAAYPDEPALASTRRAEQTCACERLGVKPENLHRFGLPDGDVSSHEDELTERLLPLLARGTQIIAPWPHDYHPDHEACGRAAAVAAAQSGASLTSYFFWTWHRGTPDVLQNLDLRRLLLDATLLTVKEEALLCHASQLQHPSGKPILPDDLLGPAERPYEVFLVT